MLFRRKNMLVAVLLSVVYAACPNTIALAQVSPEALLQGVKQSRMKHDSLIATMQLMFVSPGPESSVKCRIEDSGDRRRIELFWNNRPTQIVMRDGEEFFGYEGKKHDDLAIYDLQRAAGVRGDFLFDPRILGLSALMPCNTTVSDCIWIDDRAQLELVGKESIGNLKVWRIKATSPDGVYSEYWIEEPSFRVHRRTIVSALNKTDITSEFGTPPSDIVLPSKVVAMQTSGGVVYERIYTIEDIKLGVAIDPERFTVNSFDLPINTMANDYRINRITGYWIGEGWSELPVYTGERPEVLSAPDSLRMRRLLMISLNVLMVAILLFLVWKRKLLRHINP